MDERGYPCQPEPMVRRRLSGVAVLLLVAVALSAGLSPAQWSQAVASAVGETAALAQRLSGAIAQVPQRPVARVRIRPLDTSPAFTWSAQGDQDQPARAKPGVPSGRARSFATASIGKMLKSRLDLPPPALA